MYWQPVREKRAMSGNFIGNPHGKRMGGDSVVHKLDSGICVQSFGGEVVLEACDIRESRLQGWGGL